MDRVKVKATGPFKGLPAERGEGSHVKKGQVLEVTVKRAADLKSAGLVEDVTRPETPKPAEADGKGANK